MAAIKKVEYMIGDKPAISEDLPDGCNVHVVCPPGEQIEATLSDLQSLCKRHPIIIRFNGSGFMGGGVLDKLIEALNLWHAYRLRHLGPACVVNVHPRAWPAVDVMDGLVVLLFFCLRFVSRVRGSSGNQWNFIFVAFCTIMFPLRLREVPPVALAGLMVKNAKLASLTPLLQLLVSRLTRGRPLQMWRPEESSRALYHVARHFDSSFYLAGYSTGGIAALDALSLAPKLQNRIAGVLLQFAVLKPVPSGWSPGAILLRSWWSRMFPNGFSGHAVSQKAPYASLNGMKIAVLHNGREFLRVFGCEDIFHSELVLESLASAGAKAREFVAPPSLGMFFLGAHFHADLKVAAADAWAWLSS